MSQEYLIESEIFGGMLRKPKVWGIPYDAWLILIVVSSMMMVLVGFLDCFLFLVIGYGFLFLVCLLDSDIFSILYVNAQFLQTPGKKKIGCDVYVPY